LALLSQEKIGLAVIDFTLPGRYGLASAEEIRKINATMPTALAPATFQDGGGQR